MSISERERQALASIEDDLASSGPELASMLAMFGRLTAGEEMPARDRFRPAAGAAAGRAISGPNVRRLIARPAWHWLWLVAAVALVVLTLTVGRGTGKSACQASRAVPCARASAPAQSSADVGGGLVGEGG